MIESKVFEVRDTATCIPVIASRMIALRPFRSEDRAKDRERWLLRRAGYGRNDSWDEPPLVLLAELGGRRAYYDPHAWGGRTLPVAHEYIAAHWDDLASGDLIDVRHVLGETARPCESDMVYGS